MCKVSLIPPALLLAILLGSCKPAVMTGSPTTEAPPTQVLITTAAPTEVVVPSATPFPPTSVPLSTLILCSGSEPAALYGRVSGGMLVENEILDAIAPDPIELRGHVYHPTILEKLPTLADGDAIIEPITVREGDLIVDDSGEVVSLRQGVTYRPSDCRESACAQTYVGGEIQMDRVAVTFRLLLDLKWSDGTPLTAADSVFAYRIAKHPEANPEMLCTSCGFPEGAVPGTLERTAEYITVDEATVHWIGLPGFLTRWYFLNFLAPLPQHLLGKMSPTEIAQLEESRFKVVGWGPFMVDTWVPGTEMRLVRNPHYFRASEGLPLLDEVIVRFAGQAHGVGLKGVLEGECDLTDFDSLASEVISAKALPNYLQAQGTGALGVVVAPGFWDGIAFGIDSLAARPDFFGDLRVRQAIAYGTDREAIAEAVTGLSSVVADSYTPPDYPLYAGGKLVRYAFSPERAREVLAEAGWVDSDGDGIVELNGEPFRVTLLATRRSQQSEGVAVFEQNMADIGIKVEVEFPEPDVLYGPAPEGLLAGRNYDLVWAAWPIKPYVEGGNQPACSTLLSRAIPGAGQAWDYGTLNVMGYSSPELDAACEQGLSSLDAEEAARGHIRAQEIFSQDLPILPLYFHPVVVLARPGVAGFRLEGSAIAGFEEMDIQGLP